MSLLLEIREGSILAAWSVFNKEDKLHWDMTIIIILTMICCHHGKNKVKAAITLLMEQYQIKEKPKLPFSLLVPFSVCDIFVGKFH